MANIIVLDRYFFENFTAEQVFKLQNLHHIEDFHLVSLVDIDLIEQSSINPSHFLSFTSSSKYKKLTSKNWRQQFESLHQLNPNNMRIFHTISQLNEFLLQKIS